MPPEVLHPSAWVEVYQRLCSNGSLAAVPYLLIGGVIGAMLLGAIALCQRDAHRYLTRWPQVQADLQQANAERQQTREFLKTVIDHLPVAVFVKDGRADHFGEILLWNQTSEQMFGLTAEQAIGKTVHAFFPQEQADFFLQKDREAFERGTPEDIPEEPIDSHSLGRLILHTVKVLLYDDHQQPEYLLCFSEDITERKQTETSLRQSEERYRQLSEDMPALICQFLPDSTLTYVNTAYCEYFNLSPDELQGYRFLDFLPNEVERAAAQAQYMSLTPDNPVAMYEHSVVRPDGSAGWQQWVDRAFFDEQGHLTNFQSIGFDITDRKQVETQLREQQSWLNLALEAAKMGIWELNLLTDEEIWSPQMEALFGFAPGTFDGKPDTFFGRVHPDDLENVQQANMMAMQIGSLQEEFRIVFPDQTMRWIYSLGKVFYDETGHPIRLVGVDLDITERKQAEATLQVRAQQQAAIAQLGQFALAATDLSAVMDRATVLVAQGLGVEYCKVLERLPDGTGLLLRAGVGWQPRLVGQAIVGMDDDSQASYTLSINKPVIVEDLQTDPRFNGPSLLRVHQVVSGLSVIIQGSDTGFAQVSQRPFGLLGAHSTQRRHFTQDDINFLQAVANILAAAIARKHAEEAHRNSEAELRALFAAMTDEVVVRDAQGRCLKIAPTNASTFYKPVAEMLGKTIHETFPTAQSDILLSGIQSALVTRQTVEVDFSLQIEEQVVWFATRVSPLTADSVVIVARDISDRKHVEQQLSMSIKALDSHFDTSLFAIIEWDKEGKIKRWSEHAEQIFGWSEAEIQAMDIPAWKFVYEEDFGWVSSQIQALRNGLIKRGKFENRNYRKDGTVITCEWHSSAIFDDAGNLQSMLSFAQDITDRKQADIALQASEQRYRAIVEDQAELLLRWTPDRTVRFVNEAYCRFYGVIREEFIGQDFLVTVVDESIRDWLRVNLETMTRSLTPANPTASVENWVVDAAGQHHFYHFSDLGIFDADGHLIEIQTVGYDITDRKRAEDALQESETRFRQLAENIQEVFWMTNTDFTQVFYVSPAYEAIWGRTCASLYEQPASFVAAIHPEDRDRALAVLQQQPPQPWEMGYRVVQPDGSLRWIWEQAFPIVEPSGEIQRVVGICQDISDRKAADIALAESQKQYQNLVENSPDIIERFDLELRHLYVSPALTRMTGIPVAEFLGKTCRDLSMDESMINNWEAAATRLLATGQKQVIEFDTPTLNGIRSFEMAIVPELSDEQTLESILCISRDISDRKTAETALQQSLQRSQSLNRVFQAIRQSFELDIIFATATAEMSHLLPGLDCYVVQYLPTQAVWKHVAEFRHNPSLPSLIGFEIPDSDNPFAEQLKRLQIVRVEATNRLADPINQDVAHAVPGAWVLIPLLVEGEIWGSLTLHTLQQPFTWKDEQVELAQTVATQLEVAIQQAELYQQVEQEKQNLFRSQTALLQAQQLAQVGNWELDVETQSMVWSDTLFQIFGFDPALPEPDFAEVMMNHVHPEDRPWLEQALMEAMTQGIAYEIDLRIFRADGSMGYMEARAEAMLNEQGQIVKIFGTSLDISDRKAAEIALQQLNDELELRIERRTAALQASEARFRGFFDFAPIGIAVADVQTYQFTAVNQAFCELLGYGEAELLTLGSCPILSVAEDWNLEQDHANALLRGEGNSYQIEKQYIKKSGEVILGSLTTTTLRDEAGHITHLIGMVQDITDRKLTEQKIQQTVAQLVATNQELESFSYSVSHDLRAPLRHVNGFVNALQQRLQNHAALTDPKVVHYLQVIETSSQKMSQLIDGLLTLSRLGRKPMEHKPVPLRLLVDEAIALLQNSPETTVRVEFVIGELPTVQGDATLLQQVLSNLIGNAVKFSRNHPAPRIEIGTLPEGTIFVQDNGVGFEMAYADKLFGAFQRLHAQTEFEGTGIGLAIVQRIIHRHGGTIWAESQPNQGATFHFTVGEAF